MPLLYRRPDAASVAVARGRLGRLGGWPAALASGDHPFGAPPTAPLPALPPDPLAWPPATPALASASVTPVAASTGVDRDAGARPPGLVATRWSAWREAFVPACLRQARLDPGRRAVAALAAVAILAAALAGYGVWRSRPRPVEVKVPAAAAAPRPVVRSSGPTVVVAVAGGVRRPGVLTLPGGSRVTDAIRAAGGVRPGVNIGLLNLARRLIDGEQVVVGASAAAAAAAAAGGPAGPAGAGSGAVSGPLSLNTATAQQLDALPGVGPVLAARIVTYREAHAGFKSVDQLREVTGIGEAKFADLKSLVVV